MIFGQLGFEFYILIVVLAIVAIIVLAIVVKFIS